MNKTLEPNHRGPQETACCSFHSALHTLRPDTSLQEPGHCSGVMSGNIWCSTYAHLCTTSFPIEGRTPSVESEASGLIVQPTIDGVDQLLGFNEADNSNSLLPNLRYEKPQCRRASVPVSKLADE